MSTIDRPSGAFNYRAHQEAVAQLLEKQAHGRTPLAVGERTPDNVFAFTGLSNMIPGIKCIHIVRDPRDVGVSQWYNIRRSVPEKMRSQMVSVPTVVKQYAGVWVAVIQSGLKFAARKP